MAAINHQHHSSARVLIVSRRTVRKNKFVDFVGEYHLDLIVKYGAMPVIVPRVPGIQSMLESLEPIHGVLLCEGEDVDPQLYMNNNCDIDDNNNNNNNNNETMPMNMMKKVLSSEEIEEIRRTHASDTAIDKEKDSIELTLTNLCIQRGIPFLGICRGSQMLNVACGGTLYQDLTKEVEENLPEEQRVVHIDYTNYDGHRHPINVKQGTPLHSWYFNDNNNSTTQTQLTLNVNSYHHQGVKTLAKRFLPMAHSPDGLVEGFYDPHHYNPDQGNFLVGLQFHPERMRNLLPHQDVYDYPGCPRVYQEFIKAVVAYKNKLDVALLIINTNNNCNFIPKSTHMNNMNILNMNIMNLNNLINVEETIENKRLIHLTRSLFSMNNEEVVIDELDQTRRRSSSRWDKITKRLIERSTFLSNLMYMFFYHSMSRIYRHLLHRIEQITH